jgi:hypothetical protein
MNDSLGQELKRGDLVLVNYGSRPIGVVLRPHGFHYATGVQVYFAGSHPSVMAADHQQGFYYYQELIKL